MSISLSDFQTALTRSPELAELVSPLAGQVTTGLRLPESLRLLCLHVAAVRHGPAVLDLLAAPAAGNTALSASVTEALQAGAEPEGLSSDAAVVLRFATELRDANRVSNATFDAAAARFGREICLEIVMLMGTAAALARIARAIDARPASVS